MKYLVKLSRPGSRYKAIYREIPAENDEQAHSLAHDYLSIVEVARVEAIYRLVEPANET